MSAQENGGPAFPSQVDMYGGRTEGAVRGMSLRDYFAAKAMQAALSHQAVGEIEAWLESCARYSYIAADAMLKARQS